MSAHEREEQLGQDAGCSLRDDEIVTERRLSRRSFVAATGAFLTGGAMALLMGRSALAVQTDPDQKKGTDPDSKKRTDPDSKRTDPDSKKHKHHHHHHHHAPPPTDPNAPPPPPPHPDSHR